MECQICCEEFNKNSRKKITCLNCSASFCRSCCQQYFTSQIDEAKCMGCKKDWNIEFLCDNFPKSFVWGPGNSSSKTYREHREDMILDQQMTLMPVTQPFATARMKVTVLKDELGSLRKQLEETVKKIRETETKLSSSQREYSNFINNVGEDVNTIDKFVHRGHCPKEGCNGFIIDKWKCGMCETKVCSKCMEIKEENDKEKKHVCDESLVENVKFVRDSTKPCPGCRVRVHKLEGCYQMWCANCHVFFDWTNEKILTKTRFVHNPHYDEWVENGSDTGGLDLCGITNYSISRLNIDQNKKKALIEILRIINQIRDEVIRGENSDEKKARLLRMDFLENKITKNELKINIQRVYKASSKLKETNQVREMYTETSTQLIGHFLNDMKKPVNLINIKSNTKEEQIKNLMDGRTKIDEKRKEIDKKTDNLLEKLENLKEYAEEHLIKIGKRYNSQKPHLSDWEFRTENEKERERKRILEVRKKLGDLACKKTSCTKTKHSRDPLCVGCWTLEMREKIRIRKIELLKQGVLINSDQETILNKEGLTMRQLWI